MAQGNEDLPLLYGSPAMTLGQLFPGLTELQSLQLRECEHQCIGSTWQRSLAPAGPKVPHCVLSMVSSNVALGLFMGSRGAFALKLHLRVKFTS